MHIKYIHHIINITKRINRLILGVRMSRIRKKWFRKRNNRWKIPIVAVAGILCLLIVFGLLYKKEKIEVAISVENYEIYQDDAMPTVNVQVSSETDNEEILQWIESIRAGNGYQIQTEANLSKEGEYDIQFQLDEANQMLLSEAWKDRVACTIQSGKLVVKNKYGEKTTYEKTANSAEDTAFSVVTIDLKYNRIYVTNYGAGYDRDLSF